MTTMLRITRCTDSSMWYASREPAGYINLAHFHDAEVVEVESPEAGGGK